MTDQKKNCKARLISTAATMLSAAILLGGTGVRLRVSAASDESIFRETISSYNISGVGRENETPMTAATARRSITDKDVSVYINGEKYSGKAFLYKDTTYVGIRAFTTTLEGAGVSWDEASSTAIAKTASTTVTATKGKTYIVANGRYLWAKTGIIIEDGVMYVPIRSLCIAYGASLTWDGSNRSVSIKKGSGTIKPGSEFYREDEVYWLSKIIHAESRGESLTGKIAVGNVVLNRVANPEYPNTIYGVIFDRKYGVQFSPVADGSINLTPGEDSIIAAKLCLEGYTVSDEILFFINASIAHNLWVTNNRPYMVSIGKHDFYA